MKPHVRLSAAPRLALALCMLLLAGSGWQAAQAQQQHMPAPPTLASATTLSVAQMRAQDPAWKANLQEQLVTLIGFEIPNLRVHALQQIIFLATTQHDAFDFTGALPTILSIYEDETDVAYRTMALAALHAIGDEAAMRRLEARVDAEPSKRIRLLTKAALKDYHARQAPYHAQNGL